MTANSSAFSESLHCLFLDTNLTPFEYISVANVIACVLNAIFAFIATFSNAVVLLSIYKTPSLHTPANILLCCVAFSDFLVGSIVQPLDVAQRIMEETANYDIYCDLRLAKNSIAWIISSVSFCILTTIAVERLIALLKPLRHNALIRTTVVLALVVFYWILCSSFILARFVGLPNKPFFGIASAFIFISLIINVVSYFRIFQVIKRQKEQIHSMAELSARLHGQMTPNDIRGFKTLTLTFLYVFALIFFFYIPFICYLVTYVVLGFTGPVKLAYVCMETFSYLNASINPFVYSYRLRSIRQAVRKIILPSLSLNRKNTVQAI